jgi:hypothetical protein
MILNIAKQGLTVEFVSQGINDDPPVDVRDGSIVVELAYLQDANLLETDTAVFVFASEGTDSGSLNLTQNIDTTAIKVIGITAFNRIGSNRVRAKVTDQIGSTLNATLFDVPVEPGEMVSYREGALTRYNADGAPYGRLGGGGA